MMRNKRKLLNETSNVPPLGALKFASIMSGLRARATATKLERAKQQFSEDSPRVERLQRRMERMQKSADVLERRHAAAVAAVAYDVRRRSGRDPDAEGEPGAPERPPHGGGGHGGEGGGSGGHSAAPATSEGASDTATAEPAGTEGEETSTSTRRARKPSKRKDH